MQVGSDACPEVSRGLWIMAPETEKVKFWTSPVHLHIPPETIQEVRKMADNQERGELGREAALVNFSLCGLLLFRISHFLYYICSHSNKEIQMFITHC